MPAQIEDPIRQLITSTIPERLWHYTDIEGFHGIVTSQKMRATDIRFLNDKEEAKHAVALAKRLLFEIIPSETTLAVRKLVMETYESFVERGSLSPRILQLFTASFTLNGDQLSQWRGYSRASAGVSLGFDLRTVRAFAKNMIFAPCVYRDEDKQRLLRYAIVSFVESVLKLAEQTESYRKEDLTKIKIDIGIQLLNLVALLKHSAFEEEQEWRIVFPYFTNVHKPSSLQFRLRPSTLVPFIEYPLSWVVNDAISFNLKEVILGPGFESETGSDAMRAFLSEIGHGNITIRESRIPYRPW